MAMDNIPGTKVFRQRDVRETPNATVELAAQLSPIGSVIAWLKSFTNTPSLPAGWVECDGAAINDADSVYNGQNSPDLNGGIFLRGDTTSGGTGGATTNTTKLSDEGTSFDGSITGNCGYDTGAPNSMATIVSGSGSTCQVVGKDTDAFSILPPYYNIVWIMRIK
jgi:hypothetical protein